MEAALIRNGLSVDSAFRMTQEARGCSGVGLQNGFHAFAIKLSSFAFLTFPETRRMLLPAGR